MTFKNNLLEIRKELNLKIKISALIKEKLDNSFDNYKKEVEKQFYYLTMVRSKNKVQKYLDERYKG